jgi:hypothetical protein
MGLLSNLMGSGVDDPRFAATTQLAQGLLSSPRLMQGLSAGLGGYQQAMAQARQQKAVEELRQMQLTQQRMQLEAAQREQQREQGLQGAFRNAYRTPTQMAVGQFGPTQQAASSAPAMQGGFDMNALRAGIAAVDPAKAFEMFQPKARKIKEYREVRNADGTVTVQGFDEEGNVVDTKAAPFKAQEIRDGGGAIVGIDPITGKMQVLGNKTQSPDSKASNALGWANYGISKQRLALDKQSGGEGGKAPAGYRWKADGSLEAIPGGPADKAASSSEGERKAGTLLTRLEGSLAQLTQAVQESPSAAKPSVFAAAAGGVPLFGEVLRNSANSPERQRVEAAQLDILDAALTLGTGAAYTREQLEGYRRSYFPQLGDDEATIRDKEARLNTVVLAARIQAGRSAGTADAAAGVSSPGVEAALQRARQANAPFRAGAAPLSQEALDAAFNAYAR